MPGRQLRNDSKTLSMGDCYMATSFMTNGTSSPVVNVSLNPNAGGLSKAAGNTLAGEGLITVVRTGVGTFICTMEPGFSFAEILAATDDLDNAAADGAYATIGQFSNLGAAAVNGVYPQITFVVETRASGGALTDYGTGGTGASRRVSIQVDFKSSGFVGK